MAHGRQADSKAVDEECPAEESGTEDWVSFFQEKPKEGRACKRKSDEEKAPDSLKSKRVRKKLSATQKEANALSRREQAPAPFGHCPHASCKAPLRVVPPLPGGRPKIACPGWRVYTFSSKGAKQPGSPRVTSE